MASATGLWQEVRVAGATCHEALSAPEQPKSGGAGAAGTHRRPALCAAVRASVGSGYQAWVPPQWGQPTEVDT
jgi:hypothetical protein